MYREGGFAWYNHMSPFKEKKVQESERCCRRGSQREPQHEKDFSHVAGPPVQGPRCQQWQEWPQGALRPQPTVESKHVEPSVPRLLNKLKVLEGDCSPRASSRGRSPYQRSALVSWTCLRRQSLRTSAIVGGCGIKVVSL